jgi:hypothetical protein
MNKTKKGIFLNFLFILLFISPFALFRANALTSEISKIRLRRIAGIIRKFTDAKEKLSDPIVQESIFDQVGQELTLEPDEKPNKKAISDIARDVRKTVIKRFPDSVKQIKSKAEKEAAKKFKLKDKLEFVTVKVIRGAHSYPVSGIFYRYGIGGKSVVIGDHTPIAFMDLSDTDRAKFDKAFCALKRKEYVDVKIRNYYKKKQSYLNQLFEKKLEKIAEENESLGYIYVWNKWRTPKEVTEYLIQQNIRHQPKDDAEELSDSEASDDADSDLPENLLDMDQEESADVSEPDVATKPNIRLAKLRQQVEKMQMEIAGSQYGIDADQGFSKGDLLVLIGMKQEDVNLLTGLDSKGDSSTLSYPKGAIDTVTFYFANHILYKIEVVYRIGPPEAMRLLLDTIHDDYGTSIEMKERNKKEKERLARLKAVKHLCPKDKKGKDTHKWGKNGVCKKCKVRKADLYPPPLDLNIVETWKGNIITAKLLATIAEDQSNFTRFVLLKENPQIKEEQDQILEAEKIRKAEIDRQRRIEEYKNDVE